MSQNDLVLSHSAVSAEQRQSVCRRHRWWNPRGIRAKHHDLFLLEFWPKWSSKIAAAVATTLTRTTITTTTTTTTKKQEQEQKHEEEQKTNNKNKTRYSHLQIHERHGDDEEYERDDQESRTAIIVNPLRPDRE